MKSILLTMMMVIGGSLLAGGSEAKGADRQVTGYKYTDDGGRNYEIKSIGDAFLLCINDDAAGIKGCCMMDSLNMMRFRKLLAQTTLTAKKEDHRVKDAPDGAKTWKARVLTSWGKGEEDYQWMFHYGYIDGTPVADAAAMRRCMNQLDGFHQLMREVLQEQQTRYGYQGLVCMERMETGFPFMAYDKNGNRVDPMDAFWYFNYGDRCEARALHVPSEEGAEHWRFGKEKAEQIGKAIERAPYVKPKEELFLLDGTRMQYTFFFFDGECVSYDVNYMHNCPEGMTVVVDPGAVEFIIRNK